MSRKLDAAIARALGRKVEFKNLGEYGVNLFYADQTSPFALVPHYSNDGNAMLELEKEMRARGYKMYIQPGALFRVTFIKEEDIFEFDDLTEIEVWAETMPFAAALAAYKALTGKEWSE